MLHYCIYTLLDWIIIDCIMFEGVKVGNFYNFGNSSVA